MVKTRMVGVNELGIRVGEDHQRAKLTNSEVDLLLDMHEEGGIGYRRLANIFGVSKWTVRGICAYDRRAQHASDFRRAAAPTIEEKRELNPDVMGPATAPCTGCGTAVPYRGMAIFAGFRWCDRCCALAVAYAKERKTVKRRKNPEQIELF